MRALFIRFVIVCVGNFLPFFVLGQTRDTSTYIYPITIDEVIIRATRNGFDINDFIRVIKEDTTFYKAFKSLHLVTYNAENQIDVLDNKRKGIKASLRSETKQIYRGGCRWMDVLDEETTGDFYDRRGGYNYYTAQLFASLFFTKGKVCNEDNIVRGKHKENDGKGKIDKHKAKLKQLMFDPGSRVEGIPFMGNKAALFDPEIAKYYDFKIGMEPKGGEEFLTFEAVPKDPDNDDVVYKKFKTWFRKGDYAVMARDYRLSFRTLAYDFDVSMSVEMVQTKFYLLPSKIAYNGNWRVFTKGREHVRFNTRFYY